MKERKKESKKESKKERKKEREKRRFYGVPVLLWHMWGNLVS
jgi:hypothetical protein